MNHTGEWAFILPVIIIQLWIIITLIKQRIKLRMPASLLLYISSALIVIAGSILSHFFPVIGGISRYYLLFLVGFIPVNMIAFYVPMLMNEIENLTALVCLGASFQLIFAYLLCTEYSKSYSTFLFSFFKNYALYVSLLLIVCWQLIYPALPWHITPPTPLLVVLFWSARSIAYGSWLVVFYPLIISPIIKMIWYKIKK